MNSGVQVNALGTKLIGLPLKKSRLQKNHGFIPFMKRPLLDLRRRQRFNVVTRSSVVANPEDADRSRKVFDVLEARVLKLQLSLLPDVISDGPRYTYTSRLRNPLKPRGDVDCVTEYVAVIYNDVADIHSNPEQKSIFARLVGVVRRHIILNLDRAIDR